jgi:hypothetical protein
MFKERKQYPEIASHLSANLAKARNLADAQSLLKAHEATGWTDAQMRYARSLASPREAAPLTAGLTKVIEMLETASAKLRKPALTLQAPGDRPVVLLYHPRTKSVYIRSGRDWASAHYGTMSAERGLYVRDGTHIAVEVLLDDIAEDPTGVAIRHGMKTGLCCFCNRPLKDEKSTKQGYGPVCAENFKLPWGG